MYSELLALQVRAELVQCAVAVGDLVLRITIHLRVGLIIPVWEEDWIPPKIGRPTSRHNCTSIIRQNSVEKWCEYIIKD